jgi:hypothetical protein
MAVLQRFKRCNPWLFAESDKAVSCKTPGVRLAAAESDRANERVSRNNGLFIDTIR